MRLSLVQQKIPRLVKLLSVYSVKKINHIVSSIVAFIASYSIVILFPHVSRRITREDGIIESMGAILFLLASIILLFTFIKILKLRKSNSEKSNWRNIWIPGMSLFFFIAFGEEISWGQRIFDFTTPALIEDINAQDEFNLHNIEILHGLKQDGSQKTGLSHLLTSHAIFYEILLIFMVIVPVLALLSTKFSRFIEFLGMPLVPLWIGGSLLLVIFFPKLIEFFYAEDDWLPKHSLVEIKETNIALLVSLMAFSFLKNPKGERMTD